MKLNKIMILLLLTLMLLGSVSTVNAGWFDFLSGTTNINDVEFKIPEGFSDNTPKDDETETKNNSGKVAVANFNVKKNYVEKEFTKNDANSEAGLSRIYIDVYNNSDNKMKLPEEGIDNSSANGPVIYGGTISDIEEQLKTRAQENNFNITWNAKEISGHKGMLGSSDHTVITDEKIYNYEFDYMEGNKYIKIYVNDLSVLDKLLTN